MKIIGRRYSLETSKKHQQLKFLNKDCGEIFFPHIYIMSFCLFISYSFIKYQKIIQKNTFKLYPNQIIFFYIMYIYTSCSFSEMVCCGVAKTSF